LETVVGEALFIFVEEFGFVAVLGEVPVCEETDCGEVSMLLGRVIGWIENLHKTVKDPSIINRYLQESSFDWMWNTPNAKRPENAFAMFDAA
jgi:hypothetical protein